MAEQYRLGSRQNPAHKPDQENDKDICAEMSGAAAGEWFSVWIIQNEGMGIYRGRVCILAGDFLEKKALEKAEKYWPAFTGRMRVSR